VLAEARGWGAEKVAARFGVSAHVVLDYDGRAWIERGFIRPEDDKPEKAGDGETAIDGVCVNGDGEVIEDGEDGNLGSASDTEDDDGKPLSDSLVRDLIAHLTFGLRLALGEHPDMALIVVTHALVAQTFYHAGGAHCLDIRSYGGHLASHADGPRIRLRQRR